MHSNRHGNSTTEDAPKLLSDGHGVAVVQPQPSVLHLPRRPQEAAIAKLLYYLMGGEGFGRLPLIHVGVDVPLDQLVQRLRRRGETRNLDDVIMFLGPSLVPKLSVYFRECTWGEPGSVQYLDLNRWDGVRVGLGPGYGIVSGNVSGNTAWV